MSQKTVMRNYKDTMFRLLFQEKKELLGLYNAVNGTHYNNEEDLEINTLENAIYMNMKNDISFVLDFQLNLYEHQSSVNPNMPLRNLFYVSKVLQNIVSDDNLYGRRLLKIPTPKFLVFYNGSDEQPEKVIYRLSDMFEKPLDEPQLELVVTILNVNPGKNEQLLTECQTLKEYMQYVMKVRKNLTTMKVEEAVTKAVTDCIEEGILLEFLKKHQAEAIEVSIFEYNEEAHIKSIREESREEGLQLGIEMKLHELVQKKLERGKSITEIAQELEDTEENIQKIIHMLK